MKILIVHSQKIPAFLYGGTERVIWCLGKELDKLGHKIVYLVPKGSYAPFAEIIEIDEQKEITSQIPKDIDLIHFHIVPSQIDSIEKPYVITMHGNTNDINAFDKNTIFLSKNHANRYQSENFVYNGLDWSEYSMPDLNISRHYFHFLGKAAWRLKNVQGAINIIKATKNEQLKVLGGTRFNLKMGLRFTFSHRVKFYNMVGGKEKDKLLNSSKGLIFPVLWHEPFGLSIIESLYFGCPVFATPYGSLPEIVSNDVGFLSNKIDAIVEAIQQVDKFSAKRCNEYVREQFNSQKMALGYLDKYHQVLSGKKLNNVSPQLNKIQTQKFLDWL